MFKLKSHPTRLLYDHLKSVGQSCKEEILSKNLKLNMITKEKLADISYLIGISHDFGKALYGFQKHLFDSHFSGSNHSPVSAVFVHQLVKDFCKKNDIDPIFYWISYLCVKKHHGNLSYITDHEINEIEVKNQIKELKLNRELNEIYGSLLKDYNISYDDIIKKLDVENILKDEFKEKNVRWYLHDNQKSFELFYLTELLYSVLIDFDKKDAAGIIGVKLKKVNYSPDIVNNYLNTMRKKYPHKFGSDIFVNQLKNKFYDDVLNNKKVKEENKIYTISAPTGIGKTLTSISLAMKLRNMISQDYKIIYILPFTTLIDQNYNVFKNVLRERFQDFDNDKSEYIIKHHYLSNERYIINTADENYCEENYLNDLLFIKSWQSNAVVSTYIQLLKTIIGNKRDFINKFHNLVNSIIILDEVQFIGNQYWELINKALKVFSEIFNTYFILMTATQPKIFSSNESVELFNDSNFLMDKELSKRKYIYLPKEITIEELSEMITNDLNKEKYNRIIAVLNTKNSSKELYDRLKEKVNGYVMIYLSKNLTHKDVNKRIKSIIESKQKKYIIVTTQLIEAGVDISSDILYRDIAIIPSIIQSGGRCNRFNEINEGIVKIINIVNENKNLLSKYVYDSKYVDLSRKILKENNELNERKIVSLFFESVANEKNCDILLNKLEQLHFEEVDKEFKLIKESSKTSLVFLEQDLFAKKIFSDYLEKLELLGSVKDKYKVLGDIKKLKSMMEEYTLDIAKKDIETLLKLNVIKEVHGQLYIPSELVSKVYDTDIGYNPKPIQSENDADIV